jgi:hypothetical protein
MSEQGTRRAAAMASQQRVSRAEGRERGNRDHGLGNRRAPSTREQLGKRRGAAQQGARDARGSFASSLLGDRRKEEETAGRRSAQR